jgi:superfamily I DNA and/or RNA helicase
LLSSITEVFPEVPKTLLKEHYRCHPKIIDFCNRKFYNDQLIILSEGQTEREPLLVYKTTEG